MRTNLVSQHNTEDWLTYYFQNPLNTEFNQYMEYYLKSLDEIPKILIIEDDISSFKLIQAQINRIKPETKCFLAGNLGEALEIMNTFKFKLIIADVVLENDQNGIEICEKIKCNFPETIIMIISSNKLDHINYFVQKPVPKNKIQEVMEMAFGDSDA